MINETQNENRQNMPLKPIVKLLYNGKDASQDFSKYSRELSYTEYEEEQSDELNIVLNNNDGYFTNLWYPEKGDRISASVAYGNFEFDLGTHTIDEDSFKFDVSGDIVEIRAQATSTNLPVRTKKTINYTGKTLNQIAAQIGKNHGFKVLDNTGNIKVGTIIQKNESDIEFLKRISKLYGYIFNIKDGLLTFISLKELESGDSLFTLSKSSDIENLRLKDTLTKIYGKCTVKYMDLKTKTLKSYTAVRNNSGNGICDVLPIHKKCNSLDEAKLLAESTLKSSAREVTGIISLSRPNINFMAGVNFDIEGIGKLDGKFHIKSMTLKISDGLKQEGEISKC